MNRLGIYFFFVTAVFAQATCAIHGLIVDSSNNHPIPGAQIFAHLAAKDDDSAPPVRRIARADGSFCFENLVPGDYFIDVAAAAYIEQAYGAEKPGDEGEAIEVSAEKPGPALTINMIPAAALSGTVTDDEHDPVSGAAVTLFERDGQRRPLFVQIATTDDQGRYRFGDLLAGTYLIAATPDRRVLMSNLFSVLDENGRPLRKVQGQTYYKNAIFVADATPLPIKAGQQLSGLTIAIRTAEARRLSGNLSAELLAIKVHSLYLMPMTYGKFPLEASVPIQDDGSFLVEGLFPGSYLLQGGHVRQTIDLSDGDVDGLTVEVQKSLEVRLKIHPGTNPLRVREIAFLPQTGPPFAGRTVAKPQSDNTFKATLPADDYEIRLTADTPCSIDHMLIDGVQRDGNVFTIRNGDAPKTIELFLTVKE